MRVIVFGIDKETGAATIEEICEADTFPGAVDAILQCGINGIAEDNAWVSVEHSDGSVRYLQPDCISLSEAVEAAVGTPAFRNAPPPPDPRDELIKRIQDALNTEETGDALVEIARNACRAEQELAAQKRAQEDGVKHGGMPLRSDFTFMGSD